MLTGKKIWQRSCQEEVRVLLASHQLLLTILDTNEDGNHQYLLFSATFDKNMRKLAKNYLANNYVRIRIGRAGSVHGNVKQHVSLSSIGLKIYLYLLGYLC